MTAGEGKRWRGPVPRIATEGFMASRASMCAGSSSSTEAGPQFSSSWLGASTKLVSSACWFTSTVLAVVPRST